MLVLKPLVLNCLIRQCTEGLKLNFHQNIIGGIRPQSPHGSYTTVRACIPSVHTICSCMPSVHACVWGYMHTICSCVWGYMYIICSCVWGYIPTICTPALSVHAYKITVYVCMHVCHLCMYLHVWTINEPHLPYKTGLDVIQTHPAYHLCLCAITVGVCVVCGECVCVCVYVCVCVWCVVCVCVSVSSFRSQLDWIGSGCSESR